MKKYIFLLISIIFLMVGCSNTGNDETQQRITNSMVSIGSVNSEQEYFEKQKLTYEITIANGDDISIVDSVNVIPTKVIEDRLIETINQGIKYNQDTIEINGEIIFDSKGLTKEEITNFEPFIKGLQFIGDNNKEYFLVNNQDE